MCFDGIFSCRDAIKNALCVLPKRSIFELELEGTSKGKTELDSYIWWDIICSGRMASVLYRVINELECFNIVFKKNKMCMRSNSLPSIFIYFD